jgi:hypothetical protein
VGSLSLRALRRKLTKRSSNIVLLLFTLTLLSCKRSETTNGSSAPQLKQPSDSSGTSGDDSGGTEAQRLLDRTKELQARLNSDKTIPTSERQKMLCEMGESTRKAASLGNGEAKLLYAGLVARTPTHNLGTYCLDASPDTLREVETYITELSIKEKMNDSLQSSLLKLSDDLEAKSHSVDDPESVRKRH